MCLVILSNHTLKFTTCLALTLESYCNNITKFFNIELTLLNNLKDFILMKCSLLGLHIMQVLKKHNYTRFEKLIKKYPDLVKELGEMKNSAFFVPTNEAFTSEVDDLLDGDNKLPDEAVVSMIKYHISPKKINSCEFNNNEMIETGIAENARINLYSTVSNFDSFKKQFYKYYFILSRMNTGSIDF